jgi:hypothetical protein
MSPCWSVVSGARTSARQQSVPPNYRRVDNFSEGLAAVNTGSGQAHNSVADACEIGFVNKEGEFVIPPVSLQREAFIAICVLSRLRKRSHT